MQIVFFLYKLLLISTPIAIIILALWLRKRTHAEEGIPKWHHILLALLLAPSIAIYPFFVLIPYIDTYGILTLGVLSGQLLFSVFFYIATLLLKPKSFVSTISLAVSITFILMSILILSDGEIRFDKEIIIVSLTALGMACFSGIIYWLYMRIFYKEHHTLPPHGQYKVTE